MNISFILNYFLIYLCLVATSFALLSNENDRIESGLISDNQIIMLRNHSQILPFFNVIVILPPGKVQAFVFSLIEKMTSKRETLLNLSINKPQTILLFSNDIDKADFKTFFHFKNKLKG